MLLLFRYSSLFVGTHKFLNLKKRPDGGAYQPSELEKVQDFHLHSAWPFLYIFSYWNSLISTHCKGRKRIEYENTRITGEVSISNE